jgi:hypothetical protein
MANHHSECFLGSMGLPLLGEMLEFATDQDGFVRKRTAKVGLNAKSFLIFSTI